MYTEGTIKKKIKMNITTQVNLLYQSISIPPHHICFKMTSYDL